MNKLHIKPLTYLKNKKVIVFLKSHYIKISIGLCHYLPIPIHRYILLLEIRHCFTCECPLPIYNVHFCVLILDRNCVINEASEIRGLFFMKLTACGPARREVLGTFRNVRLFLLKMSKFWKNPFV